MKRLLVALVLSAAVPPALAFAGDGAKTEKAVTGPGTAVVKQANQTIADLLKQKPAAGSPEEKALAGKVTTSLRGFLDIDQLGKRAMVDQWAKLSKEQQEQFSTLLRQLIEDNYIKGFRANLKYDVVYNGETTDKDGNITVATTVKTERKGRPFSVSIEYVLVKDGDKLKAFDIKTDGVGLVENYRSMFNKIMAKDGFEGLIAKMKKKQASAPPT